MKMKKYKIIIKLKKSFQNKFYKLLLKYFIIILNKIKNFII